MAALLLGRQLALIGVVISAAAIIFVVSGIGMSLPTLGPGVLAVAGLVPGLTAASLLLLGSPPPRTSLGVHIAVAVLVSAAMISAVLGGIGWSQTLTDGRGTLAAVSAPLLYAGWVLTMASAGLLAAQLLPPERRLWRWVVTVVPAVVVILLAVSPATAETVRELTLSTWNFAFGAIIVAPLGALSAYVVTRDKIIKAQKRAPL